MNHPVGAEYGAVEKGVDQGPRGLPPTTRGKPGAGRVDPRLTAAVNDSGEQNRRSGDRTRKTADRTRQFSRGQEEIQNRGGKQVDGASRGGDPSRGSPSKSTSPTMPTMQQPQAQAQQPQAQPQVQPVAQQAAAPAATAPGGVTSIDPKTLATLIAAVRARQAEAAANGESTTPSRDTGSTTSGKGSATSPQKPEPLDVSQVSLEKYPGGPLTEQQTADVIDQALTINGIPNDSALREQWQQLYQHMAQNESGRDPNAGNDWDSNATGATQSDGLPANSSRGIWQCIPTTFAAYHMAGTSSSIYDPVSSASASINYVMQTYGVSADGGGLEAFMQRQGVGGGSYQGY